MDVPGFLETALRLLAVIGLALGAWRSWTMLRPPIRLGAKRYYRQPDGSYRTLWGRRVQDPETMLRLKKADPDAA